MKKHLSVTGIGPYYVGIISLLTAMGLYLHFKGLIPSFNLFGHKVIADLLAVALIMFGILLWLGAFKVSRIGEHVKNNELVTDGVYAWVRNPIYTAFMFLMWGLIIWQNNALLFLLCPFYWLLMSAMVILTEERWLIKLYGQQYRDSAKKVNRCLPWPPKNI